MPLLVLVPFSTLLNDCIRKSSSFLVVGFTSIKKCSTIESGTMLPSLLYRMRDRLGAFGMMTFSGPELSDLSHSEHCQPYSLDFLGCRVSGGFKHPKW